MSRRSSRNGVLVPGLVLIAVGAWFLLRAFVSDLPGMDALWPIFPIIVGLSMFVGWFFTPNKRANHGIMIPAVINLLVGVFFFAFTFKIVPWRDMAIFWPVFPLIVGIAFVVAFLFSGFHNWGLLIPGGIAAGVGVVGLAYTVFREDEIIAPLLGYWPVLLIGLGILILIGGVVSGGRREPADAQEYKGPEDTLS
jgi:hypothetical protein